MGETTQKNNFKTSTNNHLQNKLDYNIAEDHFHKLYSMQYKCKKIVIITLRLYDL